MSDDRMLGHEPPPRDTRDTLLVARLRQWRHAPNMGELMREAIAALTAAPAGEAPQLSLVEDNDGAPYPEEVQTAARELVGCGAEPADVAALCGAVDRAVRSHLAGEGPLCECDAALHLEPGHREGCPARRENPPHGPVSERVMRHHYGASGYVAPAGEGPQDREKLKKVAKRIVSIVMNRGWEWNWDEVIDQLETVAPAGEGPQNIVRKHYRHVEQSPGVGADKQAYALAVLDDVLIESGRAAPSTPQRETKA